MGKGQKESTKRAGLLLRALECINANDYDEQRDYIIFGKTLDEIMDEAGIPEHEIKLDPDRQPLHQLVSDVKTQSGREQASRRASLNKSNQPKEVRGLEELSNEGLLSLMEYATRPQPGESPAIREGKVLDELDAHFAQEVLRKLPKIVSRVSTLDALDLSAKVPISVRQYFAEAHRCCLYGFPIACAVLCRAILESSLVSEIDPKGTIKRKLQPKDSYVEKLVEEAQRRKILTDDRPEWALRIRDAGNYAIHDLPKFKREWGERLDQIILNTRKVFLDLYK